MRVLLLKSICRKLAWFGIQAVRATFVDAVLYAACGATYGFVFGAFAAQVHQDLWRIYSFIGIAALGGFALGTAIGVLHYLFESEESPPVIIKEDAADHSQASSETTVSIERISMTGSPQNSTIAVARKAQPRLTAVAG